MNTLQETIDTSWSEAERQQRELFDAYENGTPVDMEITAEATDERPVAELTSKDYPYWKFMLGRRNCVGGFLHRLRIGTHLQLYIVGFGDHQRVYCSYFKKDHLNPDDRKKVVDELKLDLRSDFNELIRYYESEVKPKKVNIEIVLNDHIIVEYKGLYGTITNADLFHDDAEYYQNLKDSDGTMKVYVNAIDETENVRFSETRLPELINNQHYKGNEKTEKKWINKASVAEFEVGQEIECVVWQHLRNKGIFVICKTASSEFIQCLMPNTALYRWDFPDWNKQFPLGKTVRLKIKSINQAENRITLTIPDCNEFKFKEEYEFENNSTTDVVPNLIEEGQLVDIIPIAIKKEDDNILYARTEMKVGDKPLGGYVNIEEDLPEVLSYYSTIDKRGRKVRSNLIGMISYTPSCKEAVPYIKLPAIAHVEDGHYRFSVMDAVNKCVAEDLPESDFMGDFNDTREEFEVVYSWTNPFKKVDFVIFRRKNLFSFMHVDANEKIILTKGRDFYSGMKVRLWITGINRDLTYDVEAHNPYLSWNVLQVQRGDLISAQEFWKSSSGRYKTNYLGCSAVIMPGFVPDETETNTAYTFKVVYINKKDRFMLLEHIDEKAKRTFVSKREMERLTEKNTFELNPVCPLGDNFFLMTYQGKYCIMKSSTAGAVLANAVYDHFSLKNENAHPLAFFHATYCNDLVAGIAYFKWNGNFNYESRTWLLNQVLYKDNITTGVTLKKSVFGNGIFNLMETQLNCYLHDYVHIKKKSKIRYTGKFILRTSKGSKNKVIYPLFVDFNSKVIHAKSATKPLNFDPTKRKINTKFYLMQNGKKYEAWFADMFRSIINIRINDKVTTIFRISHSVFPMWFSLKSEMERIKAQKHFTIECEITKKNNKDGTESPKTVLKRSLTNIEASNRRRLGDSFNKSKNEETEYLLQVIAGWGTDVPNSANVEICAYGGYIIDTEKGTYKDAAIGIVEDSTKVALANCHISENDIIHIYYQKKDKKFSVVPSPEYIQKMYQKMRFKGRIVRQEGYRIIIESEGREFYAMMNKDINRKSLLNQFGFVIIPDMTVYISPTEDNDQWPKENTEVYIWKSK